MSDYKNIRMYHTGRIGRSFPDKLCPKGMLWGQDMRFFFTNVPAGKYVLEVQMKERLRADAAATSNKLVPLIAVYVNGRLAAGPMNIETENHQDPFKTISLDVEPARGGLDVRTYVVRGGISVPCIVGMKLLRGNDIAYEFTSGDSKESALWPPSQLDGEKATVRCTQYEQMLSSGVPLGGIGTGRFEILTNGTLGSFSCANNWDVPNYWTEGSFFSLFYSTTGKKRSVMLHPTRSCGGYSLPCVDAVNYEGKFPLANLSYEIANCPLEVTLRAQGSIVPGREDLSALPGATFTFEITNTSAENVDAAVLASLENLSGQGGYSTDKPLSAKNHSEHLKYRDKFESVDGAYQQPWNNDSAKGLLFTCSRQPKDIREKNAFTDYLLACDVEGATRHISWNVEADRPAFWDDFASDGQLEEGEDIKGADENYRPAGALARKITIPPGETRQIVFALGWYHSGHFTFRDEVDHGHAYQKDYKDIEAVTVASMTNRPTVSQLIDEFHNLLADSSLPQWLQTKLINGAFPITTNSVWTGDGIFTTHESPVQMRGAVGTMDQRMAAHPFTFAFYPQLDRNELEWFRRLQQADGRICHMIGDVYDKLCSDDTHYAVTDWPDLSCSFILQTYRHFLYTGDRKYLLRNLDAYERAIRWMDSTDNLGLGLPIGGSTYDYHGESELRTPMIYNATCYLGALRAAIDAADRLEKRKLRDHWQNLFEKGRDTLLKQYWNGQYFRKFARGTNHKTTENCFVAQLAGDWFVRVLGLEPIFPDDIVDRTLASIVELNVKPYSPAIPMEVTPEGRWVYPDCYIQQHEPYLGMELIYRGRVDDGLEVLRRRHEITWQVNANPWGQALAVHSPSGRETILFDYMTSPSTWNVLYALSGAAVDAESNRLVFRPQLGELRKLRIPVFFQGWWLTLDIDLDRNDPVVIREVYCVPAAVKFDTATVHLGKTDAQTIKIL